MMKYKAHHPRLLSYLTCTLLSFTLAGCNGSSSSGDPETPSEVTTAQGTVQGVVEETLVSFKGIKYAAAPTGDLRFKAPTAPPALTDTFVADTYGPNCPQKQSGFGDGSTNEDCLVLNVFTPDIQGNHPVMVWIHGGAFVSGAGSDVDPTRLVNEGVVVVTLNYRLGVLGFLAHPELTTEAAAGSGNYGLMDQQFALQWVQDNIGVFGGDNSNVTIFGESAGGHSVSSQLVAIGHDNLFHKAIIQSGNYHMEQQDPATAEYLGALYATAAGCATGIDDLACLRGKTVTELLTVQTQEQYIPTSGTNPYTLISNAFLPETAESAIAAGNFADADIMTGSNLDEGALFTALEQITAYGQIIVATAVDPLNPTTEEQIAAAGASAEFLDTEAEYDAIVDKLFLYFPTLLNGHTTTEIGDTYLTQFSSNPDSDKFYLAASKMHTDWRFACTMSKTTENLALNTTNNIYVYHFTDTTAPNILAPFIPIYLGATHSSEIQYVLSDGSQFDSAQTSLADAMVDYWTNFAKKGNPNGGTLVNWPEYSETGDNMIDLNTTIATTSKIDFDTTHNCGYWNIAPGL